MEIESGRTLALAAICRQVALIDAFKNDHFVELLSFSLMNRHDYDASMRSGRGRKLIFDHGGSEEFPGRAVRAAFAPSLGKSAFDLCSTLEKSQMARLAGDMLQLLSGARNQRRSHLSPIRHRVASEHNLPYLGD